MISALRRLPRLETAVLVGAFALLVAVGMFGSRSNAVAVPLDSYSSYDSDSGGYRALFELLTREDGAVERFEQRPAFLNGDRAAGDARIATLVYAEPLAFDPRQLSNTDADIAALEAWVRAGGRLVYLGHDEIAAKNGTLGTLPTRSASGKGSRASVPFVAPELAAAGVSLVSSTAPLRYELRTIDAHRKGTSLRSPGERARRDERVLLADARGPIVVSYRFGRGSVVAIVDETLFTNAHLATADRARLAAVLLPRPAAGALAFDESAHGHLIPEHWWQIVPRRFTIALGVGALAAAIALVGAALRLGPPLVPEPRDDRNSGDFARAVASLLQRARARERALRDAFEAISRTDAIGEGVESAATDAQYRKLAELAGRTPLSDADFIRGVALAQHLRTEMTGHARTRR